MNTVKLIGTLPRKPHIIAPSSDDKSPVALFTVAARNGDLGGPNYVEIKAFGEEALIAEGQLTERTKVEVIGYIKSESWTSGTGKSAKKHYRQIVVATYIKALDGALIGDDTATAEADAAVA